MIIRTFVQKKELNLKSNLKEALMFALVVNFIVELHYLLKRKV